MNSITTNTEIFANKENVPISKVAKKLNILNI